ncbi:MAG: hypothetical protein ABEK36_04625 [Candidatus Aenigmatarchaeota archaeon]
MKMEDWKFYLLLGNLWFIVGWLNFNDWRATFMFAMALIFTALSRKNM